MFSDIMHTSFIAYDMCTDVDDSDHTVISDYCSADAGYALVRTYSIIIGDDPNSYRLIK